MTKTDQNIIRAIAAAPEGRQRDVLVHFLPDGDVDAALGDVRELAVNYLREIEGVDLKTHAARLKALRAEMSAQQLDGFVVPMADEFQCEYVPRNAQRLAWLTGFLGSAGLAIVLRDGAALFVDGRYTLQAQQQVDGHAYALEDWGQEQAWLKKHLCDGMVLGMDPWLHTEAQVKSFTATCEDAGARLELVDRNPLDAAWRDQPEAPLSLMVPHPEDYAGKSSAEKRQELAASLAEQGLDALVVAAPDSVAWLFNIRGADVSRTPLLLSRALLHKDGRATLYADTRKLTEGVITHLGNEVTAAPLDQLLQDVQQLGATGATLALDASVAPVAIVRHAVQSGARVKRQADPCRQAKAIKNAVEQAGTRNAHRRDGAALVKFLCWLDDAVHRGEDLDELRAADKLESFRSVDPLFRDLSFDTISGAGANGAIVHYRVSPETNAKLTPGSLYLVDSGAQYLDGTTDVTRTIAIGEPSPEQRDRFTRVLKGHIALARAVFPKGTPGYRLDPLARMPLWQVGLDFKHGTGHGVGSYLGVHEGPQSISGAANSAGFQAGMIVSNEPGYYKEGAYGIRIENLQLCIEVSAPDGSELELLGFEPLTLAPIDRRLIEPKLLSSDERNWLNAYHTRVCETLAPLLGAAEKKWLAQATAPV